MGVRWSMTVANLDVDECRELNILELVHTRHARGSR